MSSAILIEPTVEHMKIASPQPAFSAAIPARPPGKVWDPHPLAPVFIIGGLALISALGFVGSILIWLALRSSGVVAP